MKAFGLTGNIGCGKSTVTKLLLEYSDVVVIDCDLVAKDLIQSGSHKQEINSILGADVFVNGNVDFCAIAKIIFCDLDRKRQFEGLIHPLVWATVQEKAEAMTSRQICVVESAIIYETRSENKFAAVIVAACNQTEQFRRLRVNRKMSRKQVEARLAQQLASSEKEAKAQYVIRTDCSLEQLKVRVDDLYRKLKQQKGIQS